MVADITNQNLIIQNEKSVVNFHPHPEELRQLIKAAVTWARIVAREGYGYTHQEAHEIGLSVDGSLETPEKSALFQRLMEGKTPLVFRPPTNLAYPWYEVIEGEEKLHRVTVHPASMVKWFNVAGNHDPSLICINGAPWTIESTIKENEEYIVTWPPYPMRWRLVRQGVQGDNLLEQDQNQTGLGVHWDLHRIGLSGWPLAGRMLSMPDKPLICVKKDGIGDLVLFTPEATEGPLNPEDPGGEVWIRIEYDEETQVSRFAHGLISSMSTLQACMSTIAGLQEMTRKAILPGDAPARIMDRKRDGGVLAIYETPARP